MNSYINSALKLLLFKPKLVYTSITRSVANNTAGAFSTDEKYSLHAANDVLDIPQAHRTVPAPKGAAGRGHSDAPKAPHDAAAMGAGSSWFPSRIPPASRAARPRAPWGLGQHSFCLRAPLEGVSVVKSRVGALARVMPEVPGPMRRAARRRGDTNGLGRRRARAIPPRPRDAARAAGKGCPPPPRGGRAPAAQPPLCSRQKGASTDLRRSGAAAPPCWPVLRRRAPAPLRPQRPLAPRPAAVPPPRGRSAHAPPAPPPGIPEGRAEGMRWGLRLWETWDVMSWKGSAGIIESSFISYARYLKNPTTCLRVI